MPMTKQERERVWELLGGAELATVCEGLELALAANDPELWRALAEGVIFVPVRSHAWLEFPHDRRLARWVRPPFQQRVGLWALAMDASFDPMRVHALRLSGKASLAPDLRALARFPALTTLELLDYAEPPDLRPLRALPALETVSLSGCGGVPDLLSLAAGGKLRCLELSGCRDLVNLDDLAGCTTLQTIKLDGCTSLTQVDGLSACVRLARIDLSGCSALVHLDGLARCSALQEVALAGCSSLAQVRGLRAATQLVSLSFLGCSRLTSLDGLERLVNLQNVDCEGAPSVDLSALASLQRLTWFRLVPAGTTDLSPLAGLPHLSTLHLGELQKGIDLTPVGEMTRLTTLSVRGVQRGVSLAPLAQLEGLEKLHLERLEGVAAKYHGQFSGSALAELLAHLSSRTRRSVGDTRRGLAGIRKLLAAGELAQAVSLAAGLGDPEVWTTLSTGLEIDALGAIRVPAGCEIHTRVPSALRACAALCVLAEVGRLADVEKLIVHGCTDAALPALRSALRLRSLELSGADLTDLSALAAIPQLETLAISGCVRLSDLGPLVELSNLTSLTIDAGEASRRALVDLRPLAELTALTHLQLPRAGVRDLWPLAGLVRLSRLDLRDNPLSDLGPLAGLRALEVVDLGTCSGLADVSVLAKLPALAQLNLAGTGVRSVACLAEVSTLARLDLTDCAQLPRIFRVVMERSDLPVLRLLERHG